MIRLRRLFRLTQLALHVLVGVIITAIYAGLLRRAAIDPSYQQLRRWWLGRIVRIVGGQVTTYACSSRKFAGC